MTCIKTGCHVWLEPHQQWAYGDAFEMFGVHFFRLCEKRFHRDGGPILPTKHFTVTDWALWFDEDKTSQDHNSVMVCDPFSVTNHGYDGVPL